MSEKQFVPVVVGPLEVNCYLVPGPASGNLYIIDPGDDVADIAEAAARFTYKEAVILLTHGHVDHIGAIGELCRKLKISKVFVHPADLVLYSSPENHVLPYIPPARDLPPASAGWPVQEDFKVIETPGHTPGCVCFLFPEYNALFTGDTLFRGSVGRTDLPGGDTDSLMNSIHEKLMPLDDSLRIYPGHGYSSTMGVEKKSNPYF